MSTSSPFTDAGVTRELLQRGITFCLANRGIVER